MEYTYNYVVRIYVILRMNCKIISRNFVLIFNKNKNAMEAFTKYPSPYSFIVTNHLNATNAAYQIKKIFLNSKQTLLMKKLLFIFSCLCSVLLANAQINLSPKLFIQGFYVGNDTMTDADSIQGCTGSPSGKTCNITVELHSTTPPYGVVANGVDNSVVLPIDGDAYSCSFSISPSNSIYYYIVIHALDGLDLWSSDTVRFISSSTVHYNFRNSAGSAYGNGGSYPNPQFNLGSGKFAMYSGDLTDDDSIGMNDVVMMADQINNYANGCHARGDLNGDGNVDLIDAGILDDNINAYYPNLIVQRP